MARRVIAVSAALILSLACNAEKATEPAGSVSSSRVAPPRESETYVVRLRAGDAQAFARSMGIHAHATYSLLRGFSAQLNEASRAALANNPNVESVRRASVVVPFAVPWALDRLNQRQFPLDSMEGLANDAATVKLYLIDTGILSSHEEFTGRATLGPDLTGGDGSDCIDHGTGVAGAVGGAHYGIARAIHIVSIRVIDCSGSGESSTVIAALDSIVAHAVRPAVVNISLGSEFNQDLNDAVEATVAAGFPVIAAAGNSGMDACGVSPASAPHAVTVAGSSWRRVREKNKYVWKDYRASGSNFGSCVDIFAPSSDVFTASAFANDFYTWGQGTSFAAPQVAGVAAMILYEDATRSPAAVDSILKARSTKNVVLEALSPTSNLLYTLADTLQAAPCIRKC